MNTAGGQRRKAIEARGALLGQVLAGSWRIDPPALELDSKTLSEISPLVANAGVAGLVWQRLKGTDLRASQSAQRLQNIHRYNTLQNLLHARKLKEALLLLRAHGVEPVLVKGWSLGFLYPEPGSRPFGDIDFCVRPGEYQTAMAALLSDGAQRFYVDLHSGFEKFFDSRIDELFARSQLVELDDVGVRVLKFEDHVRFLCLHLLRHGATRALWLCDVAAALEAVPEDFDWDLCLGGSQPRADWVVAVIRLAHDLLGVNVERTPAARQLKRLPRWFQSTVLFEWGTPFVFPGQVVHYLRRPRALLKELPRHWPNPIEATINLGGGLNELPRWPFQIGTVVAKTARLIAQTGGLMRAP